MPGAPVFMGVCMSHSRSSNSVSRVAHADSHEDITCGPGGKAAVTVVISKAILGAVLIETGAPGMCRGVYGGQG